MDNVSPCTLHSQAVDAKKDLSVISTKYANNKVSVPVHV